MFAVKLLACAVLLIGVHGRSIADEEYEPHYYLLPDTYFEELTPVLIDDEQMHPLRAGRERRQLHGSLAYNSDGTSAVNMKLPFAGNNRNQFSAIGGVDFTKNQKIAGETIGLAYDNINGNGLSLTKTHIPGFGDRTAAAGNLNLFHNVNHNLDANAFAARTTLNNPAIPNFNTIGGGLDYMYKNKVIMKQYSSNFMQLDNSLGLIGQTHHEFSLILPDITLPYTSIYRIEKSRVQTTFSSKLLITQYL